MHLQQSFLQDCWTGREKERGKCSYKLPVFCVFGVKKRSVVCTVVVNKVTWEISRSHLLSQMRDQSWRNGMAMGLNKIHTWLDVIWRKINGVSLLEEYLQFCYQFSKSPEIWSAVEMTWHDMLSSLRIIMLSGKMESRFNDRDGWKQGSKIHF